MLPDSPHLFVLLPPLACCRAQLLHAAGSVLLIFVGLGLCALELLLQRVILALERKGQLRQLVALWPQVSALGVELQIAEFARALGLGRQAKRGQSLLPAPHLCPLLQQLRPQALDDQARLFPFSCSRGLEPLTLLLPNPQLQAQAVNLPLKPPPLFLVGAARRLQGWALAAVFLLVRVWRQRRVQLGRERAVRRGSSPSAGQEPLYIVEVGEEATG